MNTILIIGAGRSATVLIDYILELAADRGWIVFIADNDLDLARQKVNDHPNGRPVWLDVMKVNDRRDLIGRTDLVISLLPAHLHIEVAHDCIKLRKHLITASYVSQEMYSLGDEVRDRELIFMGEMGLDPGLDHMSAMQHIHEIQEQGGDISAFRSYAGGLIAPECNNNPWGYKFTWNPRNVVLAGQGTAQYLEDGKQKFIPYHRLFQEHRLIEIPGMGEFEVYANRDSLLYREVYGLSDIPNIMRGTIRNLGYCDAWNALIKIGLTDGSYPILHDETVTYHELMEAYLPSANESMASLSVKDRIAALINETPNSPVMKRLRWLGLFRKKRIPIKNATPALILEHLLLKKWKLEPGDKDMILMQHEFEYTLNDKKYRRTSTLKMKGEDEQRTAMAKLVGMPLGVFAKLVMEGQIRETGVQIPVTKGVYEPVLKELERYGVRFEEQEIELSA